MLFVLSGSWVNGLFILTGKTSTNIQADTPYNVDFFSCHGRKNSLYQLNLSCVTSGGEHGAPGKDADGNGLSSPNRHTDIQLIVQWLANMDVRMI